MKLRILAFATLLGVCIFADSVDARGRFRGRFFGCSNVCPPPCYNYYGYHYYDGRCPPPRPMTVLERLAAIEAELARQGIQININAGGVFNHEGRLQNLEIPKK